MAGGLIDTRRSSKRQRLAFGSPARHNLTLGQRYIGIPPPPSTAAENRFPVVVEEDDKPIYVLVICSGIGNCDFAAALSRNIHIIGHIEISDKAYAVNITVSGGHVQRGTDLTKINVEEFLDRIPKGGRLVFFVSSPCPDFSAASTVKAGLSGEHGKVMVAALEFIRRAIAYDCRPELVIFEQVPGVAHVGRKKKTSPPLVGILDKLREMNFSCVACRECEASDLGGRPMKRKREIIVASLDSTTAAQILYAADLLVGCVGCDDDENQCSRCFLARLEELKSHSEVVYVVFLHDGVTSPGIEVVSTVTASAGRCLVVCKGGVVGCLSIGQLLTLFGYPSNLLKDVPSLSEKMLHLGNSISLDLLLFIFHQIEKTMGTDEPLMDVEDLLKKRSVCINETIEGFGGSSWGGEHSKNYEKSKKLDTMPLNTICLPEHGTFSIQEVPGLPSLAPFMKLSKFFDLEGDLEPVDVWEVRAHLHRLFRNGVDVPWEFVSRLIYWSETTKGELLFPSSFPSQEFVENKAFVGDVAFVQIEISGESLFWPVEVFNDTTIAKYRGKMPTLTLEKGQLLAILLPLNKVGSSSKAARLLAMGRQYSTYFVVNEADILLFGTAAGTKAFIKTRNFCAALNDEEASLRLGLLEDGFNYAGKVDEIRRGQENSSTLEVVIALRAIACKLEMDSGRVTADERHRRAAATMGFLGAQVSMLGVKSVGMKISFLWNGVLKSGVIDSYNETSLKTSVRSSRGEVVEFALHSHECEMKNVSRKIKLKKEYTIRKAFPCRNALESLPDAYAVPQLSEAIAAEKIARAVVARMALQDLIAFGPMEDRESKKVIEWKSIGYNRPATLNSMLGLYNSKLNKCIGDPPKRFFQDLHRCASGVYRHLLTVFGADVSIELSLDFAAPVGSPASIKEIMPVVTATAGSRLNFPREADVAIFFNLSADEKQKRRRQFLELVYLSNGMLPCTAVPGSVVTLKLIVDGEMREFTTEMVDWQTAFEVSPS